MNTITMIVMAVSALSVGSVIKGYADRRTQKKVNEIVGVVNNLQLEVIDLRIAVDDLLRIIRD